MFKKQRSKSYHKITAGIFTFMLIILLPFLATAAPGGDPGEPGTPCDANGGVVGNSTSCPLDNWVWILAVGGTTFGALSIRNKQKLNPHA